MSTASSIDPHLWETDRDVPILHSGDQMDGETFLALYEQTPEGFKAELIEGTVFVASPVSYRHSNSHAGVTTWLGYYWANTPGTVLHDDPTIRLGPRKVPQPDAALRIEGPLGGRSRHEGEYIAGPPELVVEVAYSSRAIDLNRKFETYQSAGVGEYLVVVLHEARVAWWTLRDGRFEPLAPGSDGLFRSTVFPGLWLDPSALLRRDMARVIAVLTLGLDSPEHAAFVARLDAAQTP